MTLLLIFIVNVVIGQAIAIALGLAVERAHSPYVGLITFIVLYFAMFWLAWRLAVRITNPGGRFGTPAGGQAA